MREASCGLVRSPVSRSASRRFWRSRARRARRHHGDDVVALVRAHDGHQSRPPIERGARPDVVILSKEGLDELIAANRSWTGRRSGWRAAWSRWAITKRAEVSVAERDLKASGGLTARSDEVGQVWDGELTGDTEPGPEIIPEAEAELGARLGQAEKGIAAVAPDVAAVPPLTLRRVTWARMSFSDPLVCSGISGRSSTRSSSGLLACKRSSSRSRTTKPVRRRKMRSKRARSSARRRRLGSRR